jgi:hypothetical protein
LGLESGTPLTKFSSTSPASNEAAQDQSIGVGTQQIRVHFYHGRHRLPLLLGHGYGSESPDRCTNDHARWFRRFRSTLIQNAEEPSDAIVEEKLKILGLAGQKYKRGEALISAGGLTPRGTVLYPTRISSLAAAGPERSDVYLFKDEFNEWKCLWRLMGKIF